MYHQLQPALFDLRRDAPYSRGISRSSVVTSPRIPAIPPQPLRTRLAQAHLLHERLRLLQDIVARMEPRHQALRQA